MNEKTKKEVYTDRLNQELLGTLGEKDSSANCEVRNRLRAVHWYV